MLQVVYLCSKQVPLMQVGTYVASSCKQVPMMQVGTYQDRRYATL